MDLPRLIALDLDGTLLPESKQIGKRSRRVLTALHERGVEVALATGKFLHAGRYYAEALGLDSPLIALDGARVSDDGTLEERCIERHKIVGLLEDLIDPEWHAFGDNGADELLLRSDSELLAAVTRVWADTVHAVDEIASNLVADPGLLVAYGPKEAVEITAERIRERHKQLRVSAYPSPTMGGSRLTVQPPDTSKGSALAALLDRRGYEPSECMVFGDWANDVPMFEIGCVNVAMANAVPELLGLADYVTRYTSEDEGVAEFLERSFVSPST